MVLDYQTNSGTNNIIDYNGNAKVHLIRTIGI